MSPTVNPSRPAAVSAAEIGRLLATDPRAAEARARAILKTQPQNADALLVLAAALRRQGKAADAKAILEPIVATQPDSAFAQLELGLVLGLLNHHETALETLGRAVDLAPTYVPAWCALGDELALREETAASPTPAEAGGRLRAADAAMARKDFSEAEVLLARLLEASPGFQPARFRYVLVLLAQEKGHLALPAIDELIRREPANPFYRELKASALYEAGDFHAANDQYEELLKDGRARPGAWLSYGRALRAIGREEDGVAAFRKAVEILPAFAQGHRTLATVKTMRSAPADIDRLRTLLARPGLLTATRAQLHFALARALEDAARYSEAFENHDKSQALRSTGAAGSAARFQDLVARSKAVFTPEFFHDRQGAGSVQTGPIFVVGMLRAGSTLVQEILAAHSAIERTGELRDLNRIMARLGATRPAPPGDAYPELLRRLDRGSLRALGEDYLERTRPRRKSGLPFFIDKLPENFIYTGLIELMLPGARIIDVRRHPLDCCVSCFTNYFPEGPAWSHSLDDLGRYYGAYVELMAHFDAVLPGRVHRVLYEELVADPEKEVLRLLAHLGLPFEDDCLRYHEKAQAIRTTSVEQARRPIYRSAVGNSRVYEPWLGPLKTALGPVLDAWPAVPKFYPRPRAELAMRIA